MPFSASLPAPPLRIRKQTIFLLAIATVLVGSGLWGLFYFRTTVDETREARRKAVTAISDASKLRGQMAILFWTGATLEAGSEDRQSKMREASRAFSDQVAQLRRSLREPDLIAELEYFDAEAKRIAGPNAPATAGQPDGANRIRADANKLLTDTTARFDAFEERLRTQAALAARQVDLVTKSSRRMETAVLSLLLVLTGGAVVSLWRLLGRMNTEKRARAVALEELRESEGKYHSIFDHAVEGIFHATPDGRFIVANRTLARMYGYGTSERFIEHVPDIASQLYVEEKQRSALLLALQEEDVISNFEFEVERADGRSIWLRENIRAVRDEDRQIRYLEGTVEDISDRWWAEQRRRLQFATSRALNEAASVADARPIILQSICEILEWDLGAVWDVDLKSMVLRCVEIWHSPSVEVKDFEQANTTTTYAPGRGLAGEVWKTGEPRWYESLNHVTSFPNAAIAVRAGMRSAFGVPIMVAGEVRHVLEFFSPKISLPDPELLQTLSAISNQLGHLIERKVAEDSLRQSETRKAAILHSALDCIISFDGRGLITEFNPAAELTFGFREEDMIGQRITVAILPADASARNAPLFGFDANGDVTAMTLRRRREIMAMRHDGTQFPAEISVSRIGSEEHPVYTAFLRDISARKAAERINVELAAVVANSNDAIIGCTLTGTIRNWNRGAEHAFGFTAEEAVGRTLDIIFPGEHIDELAHSLATVRRGDSLSNYEAIRVCKDGRRINVSLTDSPIFAEDGVVTGFSLIARDITERKRLEEQLLQSQKMEAVGRLAGGIAHDFNNILTAILGYSDLILSQIDKRQAMYKHLVEIRKAGELASSLTHQLLAFSRRQPLYPQVFCINDAVRNMHKMLRRVIGENIEIELELDAEMGRVKADPGQIEQVLLNLCVNARDAMPNGGIITIATADVSHEADDEPSVPEMPPGRYVRLTVTDVGSGIASENIQNIFEPFFTTKEKGQGTGLGLATCYGIVTQSGGYISVESLVGKGTTFTVHLQEVNTSGEKVDVARSPEELPGGSETILYVEDESNVRILTAHVLRRLGYNVIEAGDGQQARHVLESMRGKHIDLLFSDVVLPDVGAKEISDWVAAQSGSMRILFTSGYADEAILRRHGFDGRTPFLQKPFTLGDLARRVREVCDQPANLPVHSP